MSTRGLRVTATVVILWVAAVAAATAWFAFNPTDERGPINTSLTEGRTKYDVIREQELGYSVHDAFNTTTWLVVVGIVAAVAVVAIMLTWVWSKDES